MSTMGSERKIRNSTATGNTIHNCSNDIDNTWLVLQKCNLLQHRNPAVKFDFKTEG